MDLNEIKLNLSRVISGKVFFEGQFYILPTIDYEAEIAFQEFYSQAIFSGAITNTELYSYSPNYKKDIDILVEKKSNELKDAKVDLYRNRKSSEVHIFRNRVSEVDSQLTELLRDRNIYYQYSAEYVAGYTRDIIALKKHNKDYAKAYFAINHMRLGDEEIREMARSGVFYELMNSHKNIFPKLLTEEQISLINWYNKYLNAYKHSDKLEDWAIKDDDIFDGWMYQLATKEEMPPVLVKGQEVFLFAKSPEKAKQIYDSNDLESKIIIKGRQNKIDKVGEIAQFNLPDVRKQYSEMVVKSMADR